MINTFSPYWIVLGLVCSFSVLGPLKKPHVSSVPHDPWQVTNISSGNWTISYDCFCSVASFTALLKKNHDQTLFVTIFFFFLSLLFEQGHFVGPIDWKTVAEFVQKYKNQKTKHNYESKL